jgi:hypothetical protein
MKKERIMKKLTLLLIAIVLTACSAMQSATEPASDFDRAREKWQDANISHYRFNLAISCFCVFIQDMPLVIEVNDGEVVSMEFQSGNEIDPTFLELFQRYATIDKIFEELEKDLGGEADVVTVEYDETHGFPTMVTIDFVEEAADDELYLTISEFEALP